MDYNLKTKVELTVFGANGAKDVPAQAAVLGKALKLVLDGKKSGKIGRFIIALPEGESITNSEQAASLLRSIS